MQIDWLTVTAQIVNFLVLAWLLYRFLYTPITRAMERREARIAERLDEAARLGAEAEEEAERLRRQQEELAEKSAQILADAEATASSERERLTRQARDDIESQKRTWWNELETQRTEFLRDIRQRAQTHFHALARRALGELADEALEERMSRVFARKLTALDDGSKSRLAAAARTGGATVTSGFTLTDKAQQALTKAIHAEILDGTAIAFEQDPAVICGIQLRMGGQTVGWNLERYFEELETRLDQDLDERLPHAE